MIFVAFVEDNATKMPNHPVTTEYSADSTLIIIVIVSTIYYFCNHIAKVCNRV